MPTLKLNLKIKNLDKLIKNFKNAPDWFNKGLADASKRSAWVITKNVKVETPVDTGALRRGIRPNFTKSLIVIKPHNTPYAIYVHEGTKFFKGNPFMKRGLDNSINEVQRIYDDSVSKILTKVSKV